MSKESLQKFLQQMDECVELLREADKQHDPEGFVRLGLTPVG
jgi:Nif11 domain